MNIKLLTFISVLILLVVISCNSKKQPTDATDSPFNGTIHISADESFMPVIEEQIAMYEASYPGTDIIPHYKPEADCFRDLFNDSANRLVIVTRGLTREEERFFIDSVKYNPGWNQVATDAIAVIVNANSTDTLFTIERLKQQLTGKLKNNQQVVFDGLRATSTVRYVIDSILRGEAFDTSVVKAAKNSSAVIDFVSSTPNAIGLIGVSWIGNPEDTSQLNLLNKVQIARVRCDSCKGAPFLHPTHFNIEFKQYPLVRGLYYIIKENYNGLGSGFTSFLKNERGQLIFKRAYLGTVMDFKTRNVKINQTLEE